MKRPPGVEFANPEGFKGLAGDVQKDRHNRGIRGALATQYNQETVRTARGGGDPTAGGEEGVKKKIPGGGPMRESLTLPGGTGKERKGERRLRIAGKDKKPSSRSQEKGTANWRNLPKGNPADKNQFSKEEDMVRPTAPTGLRRTVNHDRGNLLSATVSRPKKRSGRNT